MTSDVRSEGEESSSLFSETLEIRGGRDSRAERPLPEIIAHYRVIERLGKGRFGLVVSARDLRTQARVALKVVPEDEVEEVDALRREARWLAALNRPGIVKVFDHGLAEGFAWLAMELVEGWTLRQVIDARFRGPEPLRVAASDESSSDAPPQRLGHRAYVRRVMRWFRDLALALHDFHEEEGIHRDLKPANILIHSGGAPYLIDFGLGIDRYDAESQLLYLAGTIPYMSPEQASLRPLGPRSDVYSLAATFHEALTGLRPVQASDPHAARREIIEETLPPPSRVGPHVPLSLDRIFIKALQKRESDRYPTCRALAEDVDAWLEGRPLLHAPKTRSQKRRAAALGLVVLLCVGGAAWATHGWWQTKEEKIRGEEERATVIAEVQHHIAAGRFTDAEDACLARAPRWHRDSELKALWRQAERELFDRRVDEALRSLSIVVKGTRPGRLERLAARAAAGRAWLDAPSYRFIPALADYMRDDVEGALERLRSTESRRTIVEDELEALCLLETDPERFRDAMAAIRRRRDKEGPPGINDELLLSYLEISVAFRAAKKDKPIIQREAPEADQARLAESLAEAEIRLESILHRLPAHFAARSLLASILLESGRVGEARRQFQRLATTDLVGAEATEDERLGTKLLGAIACWLEAGSGGPDAETLRAVSKAWLDELVPRNPKLLAVFLGRVTRLGGANALLEWTRAFGKAPHFPPVETVVFLHEMVNGFDAGEDDDLMLEVANAVGELAMALIARQEVPDAARAAALGIQDTRCVNIRECMTLKSLSPSRRLELAREACALEPRLMSSFDCLGYEIRITLALAWNLRSSLSSDPSERAKAATAAAAAVALVEDQKPHWIARAGSGDEREHIERELARIELLQAHMTDRKADETPNPGDR